MAIHTTTLLPVSFEDLSDECLLLIFSSLSSLPDQSSVCHVSSRFCRLMSETITSLHLRLPSSLPSPQDSSQWKCLFTRFSKTNTLRFTSHVTDSSLSFSRNFPRPVVVLPVSMVVQNFPNLHTLGLANCQGWTDKDIISTLNTVSSGGISLKRLELWFWQGVTDLTAHAIAATCHSLTHLHVSGTHFTNQGLQSIMDNCNHIEHLVLDGLRSSTSGGIVSMARFYAVKKGLVSVRTNGVEQTNQLLTAMSGNPNSYRLRQLCLEGSGQPLETRVLASVLESCPFLEHLNLRDVRMAQLLSPETFRVKLFNLKCLYMPRDCCSGENLKLFTSQAPNLTALYLVAHDFPYTYNVGLTDDGIRSLAASCPLLEVLYIRANHKEFRGTGFRAGFPRLVHLSMWGNFGVNDNGLTAIADGCPRLRSLSVSQSMPISVEGLRSAIRGCRDLEKVTVAGSLLSRNRWLGATKGTAVTLSTFPISELSRDFIVNGKGDLDPCWAILR